MKASTVELPEKLEFLFTPARYKVAYGGRGGSKSWGFARALLICAMQKRLRVLCAREFQNSIQDSVHRLLCDQIDLLGFSYFFDIQQQTIRGINGSFFTFAGIRTNPTKIKSMEGIDICWVEEAEKVSNESWEILIPTIRKPNSEIWISFNPSEITDPTFRRFITNPPPGAIIVPISWRDNPWFPEELKGEKDYLASVDVEAYSHIWEGECRQKSEAQIFNGKYSIEHFEPSPEWSGPYFGADWGFANDPTTLIKCWIHERKLYIEYEIYSIGLEVDHTPEKFDLISGARSHTIRGDNARPETISYLQRHGYGKLAACQKWPGSVEDGIAILRGFEKIIIHPRCIHTAQEARLYSYKLDRLTGDILPDIVDKHNHCWDAVRYAIEPIIKSSGSTGMIDYYSQLAAGKKAKEAATSTQPA